MIFEIEKKKVKIVEISNFEKVQSKTRVKTLMDGLLGEEHLNETQCIYP